MKKSMRSVLRFSDILAWAWCRVGFRRKKRKKRKTRKKRKKRRKEKI